MKNSVSQLPGSKYTKLELLESFKNVSAGNVGKLDFDDNLGFANFSIELKDDINGGIRLSKNDGWTTMATLKFKMLKQDVDYSVVWGREGKSAEYATAFVEVAEWIEPLKTSHLDIEEYYDLNYTADFYHGEQMNTDKLEIGPNPAIDFLRVSLAKELDEQGEIRIKDVAGRTSKIINLEPGSRIIRMDISDLIASTYIVELHSQKHGRHFAEQIVVTD